MMLDNTDDRHVMRKEASSAQPAAMLACLLVGAAILDVALAFWHRQGIVAEWDRLHKYSYRPYEVYETFGIDMFAALGFWFFTGTWVLLQFISVVTYLWVCRRNGLVIHLVFNVLWLVSLAGAIMYLVVLKTEGWGDGGP